MDWAQTYPLDAITANGRGAVMARFEFIKGRSDPTLDSFATELTAANERIRELEMYKEHHEFVATQLKEMLGNVSNLGELVEAVKAERAISDKLEKALEATRGQWIHSVNAKFCLAELAEVAAMRKGEQG